MQRFFKLMSVAVTCLALVLTAGATVHTVTVQNFSFSPANITIAMGDTVTWNNTQGFHNVHHNATPSLFGNGQAGAPWTYTFVFNSLPAATYQYICQVHATQMIGNITVQAPNSTPEPPAARMDLSLAQNYPNPFNSTTSIAFSLPAAGHVNVSVMNVLGQTVAKVYDGSMEQGAHQLLFDAAGLASGMYYYKLTTPYGTVARKMFYAK